MKYKSVVCMLVAGVMLLMSACSTKSGETVQEPKKIPVEVMKLTKGEVRNEFAFSGKLTASEVANLVPMINGKVDEVNFEVGDEVKAGDILFVVDNDSYVNNLSSASAGLKAADAGVAVAELGLKNATTAYENNKILYEAGAISKSNFEQVELGYEQAKIQLESAKAQREASAAQVATLYDTIDESVVESPIDGVVTACNVKAGEILNTSNGYPFTVMNMSKMTVKVSVTDALIGNLSKGDTVTLKISSVSDDTFEGTIKTVSPAANYSGTYDVEVEVPNESGAIKSGMFAEVLFLSEKAEGVFVVPKEAVFNDKNESYVYINENGSAVKCIIETSVDNGEEVAVTSGLKEGMSLIVKGHNYVEEGSLLNVVNGEE
ncbi:MAG: efflux RND transporter periplasmic adaptor subunit [Firmicutes bacterium]|nr:efflux RND transporter periplasmic adaptor subunit [Bacillota bacterium]